MIWQSTTHVTHTEFTAGAGEGSSPVWVQAEARMSLHRHTRCSAQVPLGEESRTFLSSRSRSPPVTPGRPTSSTLSLGQLRRIPNSLRVDSTWPCQQRATWINGGRGGGRWGTVSHMWPQSIGKPTEQTISYKVTLEIVHAAQQFHCYTFILICTFLLFAPEVLSK